jgi:hypothetical protein
MPAVACRTRFGRPSGPGAFRGDVDLMASSISFPVIGGRLICPVCCTPCVSHRSATGGLGKKVRLDTSAFSLASVTSLLVCGHWSDGVTLGGSVSLPLVYLASLQRACDESDAASICSQCAVCKAFLIVRAFVFLAAR